MVLIIHGTDIISSRNLYFEEKNKYKDKTVIDGSGDIFDLLYQSSKNKSIFNDSPAVFIENFFSKNKSNTLVFKQISDFINKNTNANIIFWENQEISKTALAQFKNAEVKNFSLPQKLFLFLDSIKPNNSSALISLFYDLKKTMEIELIFFMLVRQFRLLLGVSESGADTIDEVKRLAPWQKSKLVSQFRYFDKNMLIETYNKLFLIENGQKTGKSANSLEKSIDFFLASL